MGVLDEMTKGINERKTKAAGPKLTPVGTEASGVKPSLAGIPEVPQVFLTAEAVADIAKDLRNQAAVLLSVAEGLDAYNPKTGEVPNPKADAIAQKQAEAEADAKAAARKAADEPSDEDFADRMQRLKEEAQASVYGEPAAPDPQPVAADQWVCPEHGTDDIRTLTARPSGRTYLACGVEDCDESE